MSEYLVIRLQSDQPDRVSWVVADSSGQRASMAETGTLADAAQRAQQRPVIVLVPGRDVLLARVHLPVRGASKMAQAVPFALEEQLADSVGTMHFAIGPRDAAGKVLVAAVKEPLMQLWLDLLDEAGLEISQLLPDTAGIPIHEGLSILIDGADCLIRDAAGQVIVAETDTAAAYVGAMGIGEVAATGGANLYVSEADAAHYSQALSEIRITLPDIAITDLRHGALPVMAGTALKTSLPNLLQGAFARSTGSDQLWGPWRAAAALAGVFILAALGAKALEVMSLKSELRALNAELNDIASEVMPGSRIVDPMLQLEQLASSLRGGAQGTGTDFLEMLDSLSQALIAAGGTTLQKLDYRNGTTDLTLTAPDVETFDKIRSDIASRGLSAEIQAVKPDEEAVQGRLRITGLET